MEKKERSEGLFREQFAAVDPYLFCSPAGRVIYASGPLKNLLDEDLTGRNLNDFLEDALAARLVSDGLEGRSREFRCEIRGKRFSAKATPWEDAEGMQILFFPLNPRPDNDRLSDPEQNLFVAREINLELSALLPAADALAENALPEQLPELARIRQHVYRMLRLSRNLQDSSMAQLGQLEPHFSSEDLTAFCADLLDRLEPVCRQKNIILRRDLPTEPLNCRVDPELLLRMVCNLISNAVKAQPDGGAIDMSLRTGEREEVMITVIDHGPGPRDGIPESGFHRRDPRELLTRPGMGLGLALTRAFAELQGGRLLLMCSGKTGLVAKIILPRNQAVKLDQLRSMRAPYGVGIDPVLVELSTVAGWQNYQK
ncbi:MAG: PAS domain-containing sensor histidine kinase [Clostridia bacterium]|nr:PAS domain-containing sensor histidine kinase [Clostridia bacterium]